MQSFLLARSIGKGGLLHCLGVLLFVSVTSAMAGIGTSAAAETLDVEREYLACLDSPEYSAGGAAIGRCFLDQAEALEAEIQVRLERSTKRFCSAEVREAIRNAQLHWLSYRASYCELVKSSPGNTPSWIAAGACRLDLARQRRDALSYLEDHARMWCLEMSINPSASHFGSPAGMARPVDGTDFTWSGVESQGRSALQITERDSEEFTLDTSDCRYCEKGAGCIDGVFVLERGATPRELPSSGFAGHAILNVCRLGPNGARLDVISLEPGHAHVVRRFRAEQWLDWEIDRGRLRITSDIPSSKPRYWPRE